MRDNMQRSRIGSTIISSDTDVDSVGILFVFGVLEKRLNHEYVYAYSHLYVNTHL